VIWRLRAALERASTASAKWLAWRLPRRIVGWAFIRVMAHATTGPYEKEVVSELAGMEAIRRWDVRP
jgi:hypothetical protein